MEFYSLSKGGRHGLAWYGIVYCVLYNFLLLIFATSLAVVHEQEEKEKGGKR